MFQSLSAAAAEIPKTSSSDDMIERGVCLVLAGVGSYKLVFAQDGFPAVERAVDDCSASSSSLATVETDVHTLIKLADGSWSPLRAVTGGYVKIKPPSAPSVSGERQSRASQRKALGPWFAALKRAGLAIQAGVEIGLRDGAGKRVAAEVVSERGNFFLVKVSIDEVAGAPEVANVKVSIDEVARAPEVASVCWECEKTYEDFLKLSRILVAANFQVKALENKWRGKVASMRAQRDQARLENIALRQLLRTYSTAAAEGFDTESSDSDDSSLGMTQLHEQVQQDGGDDEKSNPWMFLDVAEAVRLSSVSKAYRDLVSEWTPLDTCAAV